MLFAVLFCCGIASAQGDVERTTLLKKGMDVPEFSVRMLDGTTLTSAELEGKVVLVNFWATWCPVPQGVHTAAKGYRGPFRGEGFRTSAGIDR